MLLLGVDILYIPLLCLSISAAVLGLIFSYCLYIITITIIIYISLELFYFRNE